MIRRVLIMIGLICIGVYGYHGVNKSIDKEHKAVAAVENKAKEYEESGYYKDALDCYIDLYNSNHDPKLERKIALLYYQLGDGYEFEQTANNYLSEKDDEELYADLVRNSIADYDYREAYDYLEKAYEIYPDDEVLRELEFELDGYFTESLLDMDEVEYIAADYVIGKKEGNYEIKTMQGDQLLKGFEIEEIRGLYSASLEEDSSGESEEVDYIWDIKLKDGTEGYIDENGYFRASNDGYEEVAMLPWETEVSPESEESDEYYYLNPYEEGGLWGYRNNMDQVVIEPQFESAAFFTDDGYALVKRNGFYSIIKLYRYQEEEDLL